MKENLKLINIPLHQLGAIRISNVYNITYVGIILVGEVIEGNIKPGYVSEVKGKQIEIKAIEMNHKKMEIAILGDKRGFILKAIHTKPDIEKGKVLYFHQT